MKKIKLFLITLLCMVGVMNVDAQTLVTGSPHTQIVDMYHGTLSNKNPWSSDDSYDTEGNRVTVSTNAGIAGFSEDDGNLKVSITSSAVDNTITISAPNGWTLTGFRFEVNCNKAHVTWNGIKKSSGIFDVTINNSSTTTFKVEAEQLLFGNCYVIFKNFKVYLKRTPADPSGFLDSFGSPVEFGGVYVLGAEPARDQTDYFSVNGLNVTSSRNWPSDNNHFINVNSVWEISSVAEGRFTLQSMATKKYLGAANSASINVSSETKSGAVHFKASDDYYTSQWNTPWFYSFEYNNKYLQYTAGSGNVFSWANSFNESANADLNKKYRFHRVEYVRIGVFTEQDGILSPLNYNVTFKTDDDPFGAGSTTLSKSGQTEICYEHGENQNTHVVTRSIKNRITAITATNAPAQYESIKYIVNGDEVDAISYEDIVSGYTISIIYVLADTEEPDPEDLVHAGPKFYKLYSNVTQKYLSAPNSTLQVADDSNDAIFYHEYAENGEKYLLSYTGGVYVNGNSLGAIGEAGKDILLAQYPNDATKWDVRMGTKYLTCDSGDGVNPDFAVKPSGEYELIPVTELPVKLNTVGDHRYGTFYAPVDVTVPEGLEAYRVEGITPGENADVLGLVSVTEIPANTGVILYEDSKTSKEYKLTITSNVDDATSLLDGVCPRRIVKDSETLYGLNKKTINGKETAGFYKMKTGSALSPFRAFLDYTESEQGESKGFVFSFTELDAIEAIEMSHAEDAIYDLQGRKVQNPGTGIYIVNGKKIMIKK